MSTSEPVPITISNVGTDGERLTGLPVYVRLTPVRRLGLVPRLLSLGLSAGCVLLLGVAASISPDARGVGTHEQLGIAPCTFMAVYGWPCPSCGYTTSFSLFAHLRWGQSLYNQPMGFLLALATAMVAWGGAYVALTGKPLHRLFGRFFTGKWVLAVTVLMVLAWGWKMGLVKGLW